MVASRPGTQITVEDLFFNVPTRRRAFRSYSDEFNKIIDMVGRYAIHCSGIGFTCKKGGEASSSLSIQAQASPTDRIRQIHGSNVANELVDFSMSSGRWACSVHGLVTNANYHIKKTTLLLFINHRAVESSVIKKAVEQVYANYLPKGGHPFVYLSLEIDPARVDVNVHPTKRQVHFLNEDEIVQDICTKIEEELAAVDTSRTFKTQTLLPGAKPVDEAPSDGEAPATQRHTATGKRRRNSNELVRTDTSLRKITSMFSRAESAADGAKSGDAEEEALAAPEDIKYEDSGREPVSCRLRSVKELRSRVRDDMHGELTEIIASHTFVGIVDEGRRLAAIQSGIKLYLVDYGHMCFEYFYQLGVTDFGNFGVIRFSPPLGLVELLTMAAETEKEALGASDDDFDVGRVVEKVASQLVERREMLQEYFSLEVSPARELISMPLMVKGYTPSVAKLPQFLLRLGPKVDWSEEKACFDSFLRELATFYVPEQLPTTSGDRAPPEGADVPDELRARRQHVRWAVEHIFFPACKARLVATQAFMDGGILEVASLKGLYKVFERC